MNRCRKCNKEFEPVKGLINYCSLECRNSRTWTAVDNLKKSIAMKNSTKHTIAIQKWTGIRRFRSKYNKPKKCEVCGTEFISKHRKTCSEKCCSVIRSLKAVKRIIKLGTNNIKSHSGIFEYKSFSGHVDSNLERAGVIYIIDCLGASKIERFTNILSYRDSKNNIKYFNPDFYCKIGEDIYIIEVKMKWDGINNNHDYYSSIPYKKKALIQFCSNHNFKTIWLDYDYDKRLKLIYKKLRESGYDGGVALVCKTST